MATRDDDPDRSTPLINGTRRSQGGSFGPAKGYAGKISSKKGGPSAYDPSGDLFGYAMSLLNEQGTPGSGGGMVSQAALRNALQSAYGQSEADRTNVYGQVDTEIRGRDDDIEAGYDRASDTLQQNAIQRALAQRAAAQQRGQDDLRAAQLFGFEGIAPTANAGANQVMEENIGAQQGIADAWSGFYGAGKQTALERNDAVGDAFAHMGLQQQLALQAMLNDALLRAGDYWVGGSGGTSGPSWSQRWNGVDDLLDYTVADTRNDINATKLRPKTTFKSLDGLTSTTAYG